MKKIQLVFLIIITFIAFGIFFYSYAYAQSGVSISDISPISVAAGPGGVQILLGRIIKAVFALVGSVAFIMFIYGGMFMLTSHGNPDMVKKGKDVLIWSVIGLLVIFGSYIIVNFIITGITGGAGTSSSTTSQSACSSEAGKSCVPNASANQDNGYFNCGSSTGTCPSGQTCCEY